MKPIYYIAGGLVAVAAVYVASRKVGEGVTAAVDLVGDVLNEVNPLNPDNVIYTGVNQVGATVSGDKNFNLGGATYDALHDPESANNFLQMLTPAGQITYGIKRFWNWATE